MFQGWQNNLLLVMQLGAAASMTIGYLLLRSTFNIWDQEGQVPIGKKEYCLFGLFFYAVSLLMVGQTRLDISLVVGVNLVCLAFQAYIDAKTKLIYTLVLYLQCAGNVVIFAGYLALGQINMEWEIGLAVTFSYLAVIGMFCITNAIAAGDGIIYVALLPVLLLLEKDSGFQAACLVIINLMIPVFLLITAEGGKALVRLFRTRKLAAHNICRKPFVPYLLIGFTICLILQMSSR